MKSRAYCKHFRPWLGTSKGEINNACVDDDARTSTQCDWTKAKGCWKYPKKGGEE